MASHRRGSGRLLVLLVLLLGGVCCSGCTGASDTPDWEREVVLQLFRPAQLSDLGTLTIRASQLTGLSRSTDIAAGDLPGFFGSCARNLVRIIPAAGGGGLPSIAIDVRITSSTGAFAEVRRTVKAVGTTRIALGSGGELQPSACASGVAPVDPADDAGVVGTRRTGASCATDVECEGQVCLETFLSSGTELEMRGGYCSAQCAGEEDVETCGTEQLCQTTRSGYGTPDGSYCLARCGSDAECREAEGYRCTPANVCFPQLITP